MKSPNGSNILFRSSLNSFSIVDMYNFNQLDNITIPNANEGIYSLNGSYLYLLNGSGTSSTLIVYNLASHVIRKLIPIPTDCISDLGISKQGNIYISTENSWPFCGTSDENEVVVVSPSQGIIKNITGFSYPVFVQLVIADITISPSENSSSLPSLNFIFTFLISPLSLSKSIFSGSTMLLSVPNLISSLPNF